MGGAAWCCSGNTLGTGTHGTLEAARWECSTFTFHYLGRQWVFASTQLSIPPSIMHPSIHPTIRLYIFQSNHPWPSPPVPRTSPVATLWKSCHFKLERKRNQTKKGKWLGCGYTSTSPPLHLSPWALILLCTADPVHWGGAQYPVPYVLDCANICWLTLVTSHMQCC